MNAPTEFDRLAAAAVQVGIEMAVTYRVDSLAADGTATPVGDTHHDFDAAYDDYMESHKYWDHDDLIVWEISSDGMATDVTARMIYEAEMICEKRGIETGWAA